MKLKLFKFEKIRNEKILKKKKKMAGVQIGRAS